MIKNECPKSPLQTFIERMMDGVLGKAVLSPTLTPFHQAAGC